MAANAGGSAADEGVPGLVPGCPARQAAHETLRQTAFRGVLGPLQPAGPAGPARGRPAAPPAGGLRRVRGPHQGAVRGEGGGQRFCYGYRVLGFIWLL